MREKGKELVASGKGKEEDRKEKRRGNHIEERGRKRKAAVVTRCCILLRLFSSRAKQIETQENLSKNCYKILFMILYNTKTKSILGLYCIFSIFFSGMDLV